MKTITEKRMLSENVINELQSLVSEEFLAWEMYQLAIVSMKGRKQHLLEDVSKDNGEDEFNDHFKNLCMWMQSNGIKVVTSRKEMDNLSQCTSFDFSDGMSTEQIIDMLILSENEAISHYEDVLNIDEVKNDLNTMLCGFLKDEREHLKKLEDIKNEMEDETNDGRQETSTGNGETNADDEEQQGSLDLTNVNESSEEADAQTTFIKISKNEYEWVKRALDSTPEEMDVPQEEATWKVTGKFDDGTECDIILHASEDDFYLDGVLYDEDGSELCITEPCYDILDDWEFEYDGTKYICTVRV